jgi:hypothetical protein
LVDVAEKYHTRKRELEREQKESKAVNLMTDSKQHAMKGELQYHGSQEDIKKAMKNPRRRMSRQSVKLAERRIQKDKDFLSALQLNGQSATVSASVISGMGHDQESLSPFHKHAQRDGYVSNSSVSSSSPPPPPPPPQHKHNVADEDNNDRDDTASEDDVNDDDEEVEVRMSGTELDTSIDSQRRRNQSGRATQRRQRDCEASQHTTQSDEVSFHSHYEIMKARSLQVQHKKESLQHQLMQKEKEKCTFHPQLVTKSATAVSSSSSLLSSSALARAASQSTMMSAQDLMLSPSSSDATTGNNRDTLLEAEPQTRPAQQQSVHERLYARRNQVVDPSHALGSSSSPLSLTSTLHPPSSPSFINELRNCTFAPQLGPAPPAQHRQPRLHTVMGTSKTVQRMQSVYKEKDKEKEREENAWKELDARYQKHREEPEKPAPFQLKLEERRKQQQQRDKELDEDKSRFLNRKAGDKQHQRDEYVE